VHVRKKDQGLVGVPSAAGSSDRLAIENFLDNAVYLLKVRQFARLFLNRDKLGSQSLERVYLPAR
jgi:hypothetical protein